MKIIYESGDPVRLAGRRGLFRFVAYRWSGESSGFDAADSADVVGPIGRSERLITVSPADLRLPPPTATVEKVGMHPGVARLSHTAKTSGRRR